MDRTGHRELKKSIGRGLRFWLNAAVLILFLSGFVFVPCVHHAMLVECPSGSCAHQPEQHPSGDSRVPSNHDPDRCIICQTANTPVVAWTPPVSPVVLPAYTPKPICILIQAPLKRVEHLLPYSCGPPA